MTWPAGTKLSFEVRALEPVPKGNMQAFVVPSPATKSGHRAVISDSKSVALKQWETRLRQAANGELERRALGMLINTPVEVHLVLWLVRPRGDFGTTGAIRGAARARPAVKPDIDKLQRTIFDALTKCVIDNDARICRVVVEKRYVESAAHAGVAVRVIALPATVREEQVACASSSS